MADTTLIGLVGGTAFRTTTDGAAPHVDLAIHGLYAHDPVPGALDIALHPIDMALGGAIERLCQTGIFRGLRGEALMLSKLPPDLGIGNLVLLGMGRRADWTPVDMLPTSIGAMRRALALRARAVSFAPGVARVDLGQPGYAQMLEQAACGAVRALGAARSALRHWILLTDGADPAIDLPSLSRGLAAGGAA